MTTTTSPARSRTTGAGPGGRLSDFANRHVKWVLTLPAIVFTVAMIALPIIYTLVLSLTDARGSIQREFSFIGVANYLQMLTDSPRFWPAVGRTILFTGEIGRASCRERV